jgi:hypothetical protein
VLLPHDYTPTEVENFRVKVVNSIHSQNVDGFRVQRKVNLSCRAGEDIWYGEQDSAERFSLFETFDAMAS